MLEDLLFEIQCAEEIGAYKIADNLDKKLVKFASNSHSAIIKKINKTFNHESGVKGVDYSTSQKKFIVNADASLPSSIKKEIKNMADPYTVSFRYSEKGKEDFDKLIGGEHKDPIERHMESFNPFGEFISLEEFDDAEPTDLDLELEEEVDPISKDPFSLDQMYLEEARNQMKKHHGI